MDSISGVTKKQVTGAPPAGGPNEETYGGVDFASLLQLVGTNVQADATWATVESKFLRDENKREIEPKAEPRDSDAVGKDRKDDRDSVKRANNDRKDETDEDDNADDAASKAADASTTADEATAAEQAAQAAVAAATSAVPLPTADETAVVSEAVTEVAAVTEILPEQAVVQTVETEVAVVQAVAAVAAGPVKAETAVVQEAEAVVVEQDTDGAEVQIQQTAKADTQTQKATVQTGPAVQVAQTTDQSAAKAVDPNAMTALEQRTAAAAEQADALSRKLGNDAHLRIQVKVDGQQASDARFQWSPFNQFSGYNPAELRTLSTANGQVGQAQVTNAVEQDGANSPAELIPAQTSPSPSSSASNTSAQQGNSLSGPSALRADAAVSHAKGGETPSQPGNNTGSGSFANNLSQSTAAQSMSQPAAAERPTSAQVIEQIKVNITRAAKAGLDKVTIQLKPADLGRIEVKLELSDDGRVRAMVTADVKETLDLLQRDARGLERALNDAGLRTDSDNLHFNLRGENDPKLAGDAEQGRNGSHGEGDGAEGDEAAEENIEYQYDYQRAAWLRGGVDTFA